MLFLHFERDVYGKDMEEIASALEDIVRNIRKKNRMGSILGAKPLNCESDSFLDNSWHIHDTEWKPSNEPIDKTSEAWTAAKKGILFKLKLGE